MFFLTVVWQWNDPLVIVKRLIYGCKMQIFTARTFFFLTFRLSVFPLLSREHPDDLIKQQINLHFRSDEKTDNWMWKHFNLLIITWTIISHFSFNPLKFDNIYDDEKNVWYFSTFHRTHTCVENTQWRFLFCKLWNQRVTEKVFEI